MKPFVSLIFFLIQICSFSLAGQGIILDEDFTDWEAVNTFFEDATNDGGNSNIDFEKLWISNDQDHLYLSFIISKDINLQENNHIQIHIDIDHNEDTGNLDQGIGVDLMYDFGERMGLFYHENNTSDIYHSDIGLTTAPSVSSNVFEISIQRDFIAWPNAVSMGEKIRIFWKDQSSNGDYAPDNNGGYSYTFDNSLTQDFQDFQISKKEEKHLRVLSYNALFDSFFEYPDAYAQERMIKALDPDIIAFQEIYDHTANETAEKINELIPLTSGQWYRAKISPDIICISRFPIKFSDATNGNGYFILDMGDYELLLVNAHLPCCDNNEGRQNEIDFMLSFIRDMKDGTGVYPLEANSPIIIVGDMNLVGDAQQQKSLQTGNIINESSYGSDLIPDWDGSSFVDANPPTTHPSLHITWYDEYSSFAPGRLDYQFYTGSVLTAMNSFSLATMFLNQTELDNFGLLEDDSDDGSDHFPLVVDYLVDASVGISMLNESENNVKLFPNPTGDYLYIDIESWYAEKVILKCYNSLGVSFEILSERQENLIKLDISYLPSGTYWLKGNNGEYFTKSFIVQK